MNDERPLLQNPQADPVPEHLGLVCKPPPGEIYFDGPTNKPCICGCRDDHEPSRTTKTSRTTTPKGPARLAVGTTGQEG